MTKAKETKKAKTETKKVNSLFGKIDTMTAREIHAVRCAFKALCRFKGIEQTEENFDKEMPERFPQRWTAKAFEICKAKVFEQKWDMKTDKYAIEAAARREAKKTA